MKRILALLLAVLMVFGLAACGQETPAGTMDLGGTPPPAASESVEASESAAPAETEAATDLSGAVLSVVRNMPDHIYKIGEKDFVAKVVAGEPMTILDIRSAEDYGKGHVKGAVNLPWGTAISDALATVPQSGEVFVYCYTGQTAGQAVVTLNLAGIPARSVNLGWNFGISKVEGVDAVTETTANTLPAATNPVDSAVAEAVGAYYAGLGTIADARFKNYKISEDDLKAALEAKEDLFILSVRKAEDYAKGHIEGAVNIPFGKTMLDDVSALPKDKKIVVYCYTGQTAGQATAALRLMGYDAVSLNGGMGMASNAPQGWANKGYPTVSSSVVTNAVQNYFRNMPDHIYKIAEKDFVAKVVAGDAMTIVDIRSAADYEKGHVKGAVNLPWGPAIAENLAKLPQTGDVFIYCYTGQTAGQAVVTMNVAGVPARSVNLGWNFGISKVEGVDAVTETTANTLPDAANSVDEQILEAVTAYYAGLGTIADERFKNYKVSEDDLKAMRDGKEDFYLLSVRKAEDYAKGHIQGAVNVPFGKTFADGLGAVPKDKKVVVYCYTGQTAGQAVAGMRLMGYDAVSLNGGTGMPSNVPQGWTNKEFPLVTE
jgi:rhodanese-related sulfurtransferase/predicted small lipoprotein YifL